VQVQQQGSSGGAAARRAALLPSSPSRPGVTATDQMLGWDLQGSCMGAGAVWWCNHRRRQVTALLEGEARGLKSSQTMLPQGQEAMQG
jgi:hypothetical protein